MSIGVFVPQFKVAFASSDVGNRLRTPAPKTKNFSIGDHEGGGFQEGGFRNTCVAAFSVRGNLLLRGNSY